MNIPKNSLQLCQFKWKLCFNLHYYNAYRLSLSELISSSNHFVFYRKWFCIIASGKMSALIENALAPIVAILNSDRIVRSPRRPCCKFKKVTNVHRNPIDSTVIDYAVGLCLSDRPLHGRLDGPVTLSGTIEW